MNILVISLFYNDGSPYSNYIHNQVLAYQAIGHNVRVIAPVVWLKRPAEVYKNKKSNIIDSIQIYYPRYISLSNYGRNGLNALSGFLAARKIFNRFKEEFYPNILQVHTIGFGGGIGVRFKKTFKIPTVITTHGSDTTVEILRGKARNIISICKKADYVICVSSKLQEMLLYEDSMLKTVVINNGFNSNLCKINKKPPHSIIQVSNLIAQKKVDITIQAFKIIKSKYDDAVLTIIGKGPEEQRLKLLCQELDIYDSVEFVGQLSNKEVLQRMSESEIFVMPSIREGFGIVYLEAMASGCITIGTQGEGIKDVIIHEENGILVPPDDPEIIAKSIVRCFEEPEYAEKIRTQGVKTARNLTWEVNAKKNLELFSKIISWL